jgi:outer membrane protein assembly factor BamE (lipoprotein component of BamABCDE complex)
MLTETFFRNTFFYLFQVHSNSITIKGNTYSIRQTTNKHISLINVHRNIKLHWTATVQRANPIWPESKITIEMKMYTFCYEI